MERFRRKARVFLPPARNHIAVLKVTERATTATALNEARTIFREAGVEEAALDTLQADAACHFCSPYWTGTGSCQAAFLGSSDGRS